MLKKFSEIADEELQSTKRSAYFAIEEYFDELVFKTPFVTETLNAMLSKVLRNTALEPPRCSDGTVTLAHGQHWQLTYGAPQASGSFLYSYPSHAIVAVVGPEPLVIRRYSATGSIDTDVFDPDISLNLREEQEFHRGALLTVDARTDVDEIMETSSARVVTLTGAPRGAIRWAFCRKTFRAVQPIAAIPDDANIVTYVRVLAAMNAVAALPTLTALTAHESHFVRWTALQALVHLDPDMAAAELHRAAKDPHPHVQHASEKVIARLCA